MNKDMMRRAQQLQVQLTKIQEELEKETVTASVGGGAITVVMNGHQIVQSVKIEPEAIDISDLSLLEDMVVAAVNEANEKAKELANRRLGAITGGLKLPGM